MSKWGKVKVIEEIAQALGKTTVKEADIATKAFSDTGIDLTKMLKDLKGNAAAMEKLNAMTHEQRTASLQNLAKQYIVNNKKAAAASLVGAATMGAGQQSEASEGGAALKAAKTVLEKVNTPEMAVALRGADKAEYLKALDKVYGERWKRAADFRKITPEEIAQNNPKLKALLDSGVTFKKENPTGFGDIWTANKDGKRIGHVSFSSSGAKGEKVLTPEGITVVDPNMRRQGIASSLYEVARRGESNPVMGEAVINPNKNLTYDGAQLWKSPEMQELKTMEPTATHINKDTGIARSADAAFDPRFKDSALLLAGAGPAATPDMAAGTLQAGKDILGTLKQGYDWYKENLQQPVADAITKQVDPSRNVQGYQQAPEMQEIGRMAFDPVNLMPGAAQAAQFGLEMIPDNKAKGGLVKPQYLNQGEMVLPQAVMDPVMNPGVGVQSLPQPPMAMPLPPGAPPQAPSVGLLDSTLPSEEPQEPDYTPNLPKPIATQQSVPSMPGMQDPYAGMGSTMKNIGKLEAAQIENENKIINEQANKMQTLAAMAEQNYASFEQDNAGLLDAIKNSQIDPNRYINSMDAPAKVATIFGLLLGGLGQGLAGGPNQALQMLNKQIDMDVDAQKANLQNKHNLYTANLQKFRLKEDALTATRINYAEMYKSKLLEAGGAQRSELAKQRALLAAQQLDAQIAPMKAQLAQRQAVIAGAQKGLVNHSEAVMALAPEHQKEKALAELGNVQNKQATLALMDKTMQEVAKLKSLAAAGNPQARSQAAALETMILSKGKSAFGNMSEQELQKMINMIPTYMDNEKSILMKRKAMQGFLAQEAATPTLDGILAPLGITNYKLQLPEPKSNAPIQGMKPRK